MSLPHDVAESSECEYSSVDDYNSFDELDADSASQFDGKQASKCYWLGKMFMRFVQAYVVLKRSSSTETVTDVDVSGCLVIQLDVALTYEERSNWKTG